MQCTLQHLPKPRWIVLSGWLQLSTRISLIVLLVCTGCRTVEEAQPEQWKLPKYAIFVHGSITYADPSIKSLPSQVYTFPALHLDPSGVPTEQLQHKKSKNGGLEWYSLNKNASEYTIILEQSLKANGFASLKFAGVETQLRDHQVLVLNLYVNPDQDVTDQDAIRAVSVRILASSFPKSLSADGKKDWLQMDLVGYFNAKLDTDDVVRRLIRLAGSRLTRKGKWQESINLLN